MRKTKFRITVVLLILTLASSLILFSACDKDENEYLAQAAQYRFNVIEDGIQIGLIKDLLESYNLKISDLLDNSQSGVFFEPDGTFEIKLVINKNLLIVLNPILEANMDKLNELDLRDFEKKYAETFFPGFTFKNLKGSLDIIKNSFGIEIVGINYESQGFKDLSDALAEYKFPEKLVVPEGFGLKLTSVYALKTLESAEGKQYNAAYVGRPDKNASPFLIITFGKEKVKDGEEIKVVDSIEFEMEFVEAFIKAGVPLQTNENQA